MRVKLNFGISHFTRSALARDSIFALHSATAQLWLSRILLVTVHFPLCLVLRSLSACPSSLSSSLFHSRCFWDLFKSGCVGLGCKAGSPSLTGMLPWGNPWLSYRFILSIPAPMESKIFCMSLSLVAW